MEDSPNTLWETSLLLKEHGDACGKQFPASYAFDKHRTSGYLRGTPCFTPDDGSTRIQLVATDRSAASALAECEGQIGGVIAGGSCSVGMVEITKKSTT